MAQVQFGDVSADMRLVNDFYGIPELRNFFLGLQEIVWVISGVKCRREPRRCWLGRV
jgi:hypothetical protein